MQGEAAASSDRAPTSTSPETTSTTVAPASSASTSRSGGGGGWGKLKGNSQASTPVQSTGDVRTPVKKQDSADAPKKPKLGVLAKDEGTKGSRKSLEQSEVILGQSFTEFKSDIKKEVAEVHSKISNMEDLLKNILQNMEK